MFRGAITVLAVLGVGAILGLGVETSTSAFLVWATASMLTALALSKSRIARSSISPLVFLLVPSIFYGLILPWLLINQRDTALGGVDYSPWYPEAIVITGIAVCMYVVGWLMYRASRPMRRPSTVVRTARQRTPGAVLIFSLTAALTVVRFALYGIGSRVFDIGSDVARAEGATAYLIYAPEYLASASLYIIHRSTNLRLRVVASVTLSLLLLYFFATGVRYVFVVFAVATGFLYCWRIRGSLLLPRRYLVAAAVGLFVAVGWLGSHRGVQPAGFDRSITQSAFRATEIFNPLAASVATVEANGYELGSSYIYLLVQPIPRQLWTGKPEPPLRDFIGQFSAVDEGRAFPVWGEMYSNFGYLGVALGMFFLGLLSAAFVRAWLTKRVLSPGLDVVGALILPLIIQIVSRGYFVAAVHNTLAAIGVPLLLLWIERRQLRAVATSGGGRLQVDH